jgi:hypothetical protein
MKRILQTTTLVLAVAVLLAPSATGNLLTPAERPDDRAGMLGVGAVTAKPIATRPDDRAGIRGPGSVPTVLVASSGDAFDWGDAGIGAVGAFGLALLLFGAMQLATRAERGHATA